MGHEDAIRDDEPRTDQPPATREAAHRDRKAEAGDERFPQIGPTELAAVRALIDAALARRS